MSRDRSLIDLALEGDFRALHARMSLGDKPPVDFLHAYVASAPILDAEVQRFDILLKLLKENLTPGEVDKILQHCHPSRGSLLHLVAQMNARGTASYEEWEKYYVSRQDRPLKHWQAPPLLLESQVGFPGSLRLATKLVRAGLSPYNRAYCSVPAVEFLIRKSVDGLDADDVLPADSLDLRTLSASRTPIEVACITHDDLLASLLVAGGRHLTPNGVAICVDPKLPKEEACPYRGMVIELPPDSEWLPKRLVSWPELGSIRLRAESMAFVLDRVIPALKSMLNVPFPTPLANIIISYALCDNSLQGALACTGTPLCYQAIKKDLKAWIRAKRRQRVAEQKNESGNDRGQKRCGRESESDNSKKRMKKR